MANPFAFNPLLAALVGMGAAGRVEPTATGVPNPLTGMDAGPTLGELIAGAGVPAQMLQAVQRPAPVQPIMSGGVAGSQRVQDAKMQGGQHSAQLAALLQLLQGGQQNTLRVPPLGSLIGGR